MLKISNFHEPKRSFQTLLNDVVKSGVFTTLQPVRIFGRKTDVRLQIQVPKTNFELVKTPLADSSLHWYKEATTFSRKPAARLGEVIFANKVS